MGEGLGGVGKRDESSCWGWFRLTCHEMWLEMCVLDDVCRDRRRDTDDDEV